MTVLVSKMTLIQFLGFFYVIPSGHMMARVDCQTTV